MQLLINVLLYGALVSLIAYAVKIFFLPTRFFNVAIAALLTLSAYLFYTFWQVIHLNVVSAIFFAVFFCCLLFVAVEKFIFRPFLNRTDSSMVPMMVSLGVYIVVQNLIPIIWDNATHVIFPGKDITAGHLIWNGYITDVQIVCVLTCGCLMAVGSLIMNYTRIGLSIRAVSDNNYLSVIQGISSDRTILNATIISSVMVAFAGVLLSLEFSINPTMGFNWLLYGMVALIIGGTSSEFGVVAGAFLLATLQQLAVYYFGSQWMDFAVYLLLITFLAIKPLGLYGTRTKKVEI